MDARRACAPLLLLRMMPILGILLATASASHCGGWSFMTKAFYGGCGFHPLLYLLHVYVCVFFGIIITIFCFAATAVEWWTTDANQLSWSSADGTPANAHWAFACNLDNNNFNILMKCLWCNFKVKCCCRRNGTWSCMRMYKCIYSRRICS